jgi:hypothetical protein
VDDMKASRVLLLAALLAAGCSAKAKVTPTYTAPAAPRPAAGAAPWPAPSDPLVRARAAGLVAARKESFVYHIHAHLSVFVNGSSVVVPSGLGIDIHDPGVKHAPLQGGGTGYGGISLCAKACISPLHTHDLSGVVHVEATEKHDFKLGQFFTEWGVRLDSSCVGGYCAPAAKIATFVNGKQQQGNPADIVFTNHEEIAIVIGTPPPQIPATYTIPDG